MRLVAAVISIVVAIAGAIGLVNQLRAVWRSLSFVSSRAEAQSINLFPELQPAQPSNAQLVASDLVHWGGTAVAVCAFACWIVIAVIVLLASVRGPLRLRFRMPPNVARPLAAIAAGWGVLVLWWSLARVFSLLTTDFDPQFAPQFEQYLRRAVLSESGWALAALGALGLGLLVVVPKGSA